MTVNAARPSFVLFLYSFPQFYPTYFLYSFLVNLLFSLPAPGNHISAITIVLSFLELKNVFLEYAVTYLTSFT